MISGAGGDRFDFGVIGFGLNTIDHLCVVARHPRLDSKQRMVAYERQAGGQVPTALVALQRWGVRTAYVGCFGDDADGAESRRSLAAEGVDLSGSTTRRGLGHHVSVIVIDQVSGERAVMWQRPDALAMRPDELQREHFVGGRVLLMDAYDLPAALRAAQWAKAAGVLTVLDIDGPGPGVAELLRLTDVLIASADVLPTLTGDRELRAALRHAAAMGPSLVGVTLGPGGALAFAAGQFHYTPSFRVPVVDTTGAGDIFHAGCIYGLLLEWPTDRTLTFAAAAAALKCERLGGRPGIPTVERALALCNDANR
ncbi:MAG TPA: PfkB family carbohydrate kinase [Candidatus Kryptonia bacterium]|nr:PfkB family carbohydrate kinase [Candidatus Kryptonia bacterium]